MISGLTGGIEMLFKKNKIDWIKGTARLTGGLGVEVTLADAFDRLRAGRREAVAGGEEGDHRRDRLDAAQRAGDRGRSQDDHLQRRSDSPAVGAEVDRDHGQRRGRRRVRVDLQELRQRGHGDRAAAATGARRGRSGLGRARALVQEARHQGDDRREGHLGEVRRQGRRHRSARRRPCDRFRARPETQQLSYDLLLVATGRGPGHRRPRRRASSASRWIAATSSSIRCSRPACPAFRPSATSSRWAARTTSSRTCRRWKASCSPSASPATPCSRSITTTCRAAPTPNRRLAASA